MADILIYLWQTASNNKRINTESNPNMAILSEGRQIIKLSYIASPHPGIKCHQTAKCANNVWQIHTSPTNMFYESWFFNILRCLCPSLSPHTASTAHGPVCVHVSWVVVHWGPASFSTHRQLHSRPPLCRPCQQSQRTGSQGHWQVQCVKCFILLGLSNYCSLFFF